MLDSMLIKIKLLFYKKIKRNSNKVNLIHNQLYNKNGIKFGSNFKCFSTLFVNEPYLLSFGNNVTISVDVLFLTHDNSISKIDKNSTDLLGKIQVGNNCFVGARSTFLPGTSIGDNVIVAAGSLVTKSFQSNIVVGGNPAKKICTVAEFLEKNQENSFDMKGKNFNERKDIIEKNFNKLLKK